jgi:hypothetical protein
MSSYAIRDDYMYCMWGLRIISEFGSSLLESSLDRWIHVMNLPAQVHSLESHGQL